MGSALSAPDEASDEASDEARHAVDPRIGAMLRFGMVYPPRRASQAGAC
jgi:hypothetical protein